ncbi:PEP-CTERM sorting domain-containing protein [Microcystis aeruginosa]|uniref:PEP-CTERM sorting domain-containing protein n=1 Tax=Microcystis aeruginosa TaxID=1126 RepID=UPI00232DC1E0|nr:PEP-CTERM sorting domain-containing protein [Microcystis aeruginosa]MDB9389765.1 PEP-CTERM sorting domain-containing protein [Microcystis aeruginosa CS-579]
MNFNTLPSSQGWTYLVDGNTATETDVFSISNGVLTQNTLGSGDGVNGYTLANVVDTTQPFTLSWRSRVLQDEFVLNPQNFFGLGLSINSSSQRFTVGFGTDAIGISAFQILPGSFNNTVFHNYRLEGSFNSGNAQLYIDDLPIATLALLSGVTPNASDGLFFGDATGYTNALAEISSYSFIQGTLPGSVPEPSSILGLLSLGVLGIGAALNRKL